MRPNLMVNLGLRWETTLPPTGENDNWSDFDPTLPNPGAGGLKGALIYAGRLQGLRGIAHAWPTATSRPSARGSAWRTRWTDKTVIRMSYGLSYAQHHHGHRIDPQSRLHPDRYANRFHAGRSAALPGEGRRPAVSAAAVRRPDVRQRPRDAVVPGAGGHAAAGVPELQPLDPAADQSDHGGRDLVQRKPRQPPAGGAAGVQRARPGLPRPVRRYAAELANIDSPAAVAAGFERAVPGLHRVVGIERHRAPGVAAVSAVPEHRYALREAATTAATRPIMPEWCVSRSATRTGLQFLTSYVFSKLLTDADGYWPGGAAMDPYNRGLEKSIGQFDVTHNLKFSAVWELPVGKGKLMNLRRSGELDRSAAGASPASRPTPPALPTRSAPRNQPPAVRRRPAADRQHL